MSTGHDIIGASRKGEGNQKVLGVTISAYGALNLTSTGLGTVINSTTFTPLTGFTSGLSPFFRDMDMPSNGRLRYIGRNAIPLLLVANISFSLDANNRVIEFGFHLTGNLTSALAVESIGTGADIRGSSISGTLVAIENNYVEMTARLRTGADQTLTEQGISLSVFGGR